MKRLVQRGLVLLGASAISMGLASPAFAGTHREAPSSSVVQDQAASVSNRTEQKAVAFAPAVQVAPAANVGVLSPGGQSIRQANRNSGSAQAVNANATRQSVSQRQDAKAGASRSHGPEHAKPVHKRHGKHHGRFHGKHHGKAPHERHLEHHRKLHERHFKHHRPVCEHHAKPVRGHGKRHTVQPRSSVRQRQSADVSNSTGQKAVAFAPAVQVAPALNVGVLSPGGQSTEQANRNSADASAINLNSTLQEVTQSQNGDA